MKWSVYYRKSMEDLEVDKMISRIPSLENIGKEKEVMEVLTEIGFQDQEGASQLLEKALEFGMKFSAENLVEISMTCSESSFRKALKMAAPGFNARDLEVLYNNIDDELIIELANEYGIQAPQEIAEYYEEQLCRDTSAPISWNKFYRNYAEWSAAYARERCKSLTDYGNGNQIVEVADELFYENVADASRFIERAVEAGVRFRVDNLMEISALCREETLIKAFTGSLDRLGKQDLEELRGAIDDDVIIDIAKKHGRALPASLQAIDPEVLAQEEFQCNIEFAVDAADYALACLYQAQNAMNAAGSASLVDMLSGKRWAAVFRNLAVCDAQPYLADACNALDNLNYHLRLLQTDRYVKLHHVKMLSAIDLWFRADIRSCLVYKRIDKAAKNIHRAIRQVEDIRRELAKGR